jgi:hypothetical protein
MALAFMPDICFDSDLGMVVFPEEEQLDAFARPDGVITGKRAPPVAVDPGDAGEPDRNIGEQFLAWRHIRPPCRNPVGVQIGGTAPVPERPRACPALRCPDHPLSPDEFFDEISRQVFSRHPRLSPIQQDKRRNPGQRPGLAS